jgi:hypothetical protein
VVEVVAELEVVPAEVEVVAEVEAAAARPRRRSA